ncbi:MAG: BamA/TamA family outer membrane protein [Muribaculum sp.]|nr:BamA/TamA family outer membrane protein [Muribaculaceae bacterium]MCM1080464.1 BamA/TamA family outer membrane protein [Muribaculum sp.]
MKNNKVLLFFRIAVMIVLAATSYSCSTTRRLPKGEVLYDGIKKVQINAPENHKVPEAVVDEFNNDVDVHPNNYISFLGMRSPFPVGLWVYNNWNPDSKGLKGWLYKKLVEEPVTINDVRPSLRMKLLEGELANAGYFRGSASYKVIPNKKNERKAKILYTINTGNPYPIDTIEYLPDTCHLYHCIDSLMRGVPYLKPGVQYFVDSLNAVRTDVANGLRNKGYYFFRPEYIEYLADSTIKSQKIALRITVASNTPKYALSRWKTGDITVTVNRNNHRGNYDTIQTRSATIYQQVPSRLRKSLIPSCLSFRKGRYFSVAGMNRTQSYLSRLGIFNNINIEAIPDTSATNPTLNVLVDCTFDKPLEATLEANVSSKSNSYLGPGVTFTVTNHNLFGGGEQLSVGLTGSYEWQTGHQRSSVFNSYEAGVNASLAFPRMLAPRFIPLSRRNLNWTRFTLGADVLNRPHYFNLAQFSASMNYDWRTRKYFSYTFTPLKLTYMKLIRTTHEFDSLMNENRAIALSFRNQFIPQMGWSMVYDRAMNRDNLINVQTSLTEAGNICWALWRACGVKGEKKIFGVPFSQFVKATAQLVYSRRIGEGDSWLVSRIYGGVAHAYGNASEVPYSEQFYVGGANSIRAFTVRSIGPGSYHPDKKTVNGYFDETGTFKFEFNVEYRFPIFGPIHGAAFVDTGNVWLLKNDPNRPGGKLEGSRFFKDLAVGTGVGIRLDISMLVIRGDLGIGIHAPYDTGRHGYYNMESFGKSLAFHLAIGYPF